MATEGERFLTRLARAVEARLHTDVTYVAHGGIWLTAAQIVTVLTGFILAVAFANLLPKETFGVYRFVLSAASMFATLTLPGLNTSLTRAVAQGQYAALVPVFVERVRWGVLGGVAMLIGALYYHLHGNETLALGFVIAAAFLPFSDAFNVYDGYWNGVKRFRAIATAEMATRVGGTVVMLGILFLTHDPVSLVFGYFLIYALLRFLFFLRSLAESRARATERVDAGEVLAYGKHLSVVYVIAAVASQIDKIVVFHVAGAAALAAYSFALLVPDQLRSSLKHIANIAFPKFSTRPLPEILAGIAGKNVLIALLVGGIVLIYAGIAPILFKLAFPAYQESVLLTQLLSLTLIDALTLLPLSALKAHARTNDLYRYNIGIGLLQVGLITAGGFAYGVMGVIAGLIVGRVIGVVYLSFLMRRLDTPSYGI